MSRSPRKPLIFVGGAVVLAGLVVAISTQGGVQSTPPASVPVQSAPGVSGTTTTPIKNVVVVFQENVSFDHYFATYPVAANPQGSSQFAALADTPKVNGLTPDLRTKNPNAVQPFRLDRSQAQTCDQDHGYADERAAFHNGLMDKFVQTLGRGGSDCANYEFGAGLTMGYYDGNTVTALWNYAQNFAMSDNFYGTTFGPSTPGAINLISGQTGGFEAASGVSRHGAVTGDPDPTGDVCGSGANTSAAPSRKNIGDLLNATGVPWGWFQGGFAHCSATHADLGEVSSVDYVAHHNPFQYYASTANPNHLAPASVSEIGHAGPANHLYDLTDFWASVSRGSMPAVSFLKAPAYEDGHPGYSTPLDEQRFLVETINALERSAQWSSTAVVIAYDDSDGWYDHQLGPAIGEGDRAGFGPRLPLLVISPYAKTNYVDHTVTDQTSILRFIEDNWQTGRIGGTSFDAQAGSLNGMFDFSSPPTLSRAIHLDPGTGEVVAP